MKVAQEIDVDNVTIIINPQNKLEAKIPTSTPSEVVIEEVPNVLPTHNAVVTLNGVQCRIVKLGKVNGTDWMVFQLETPKPLIEKNIRVEFYDNVGTSSDGGITFNHTGKVRVITADGSPFTPNGSSVYEGFTDSGVKLFFDGNTESQIEAYPVINFNTMTYQTEVSYVDIQTSSTLSSAVSFGAGFTAEHEDAFYEYQITEASRGADTPAQPEPTNIETFVEYLCPSMGVMDNSYNMDRPLQLTIRTSDVGNKTPITVKFDVSMDHLTRTYSYPYSSSNVYEWNNISDFNEGADFYKVNYLVIRNTRVEFTDGSSSVPTTGNLSRCAVGSQPD